jgi:hypothetical protein
VSKLDDILEKVAEGIETPYSSVRQGDKAVEHRSIKELADAIRLGRQLDEGKRGPVVACPRRPKL